ncbi:MAG TPA: ATP-binding protein [Acidimicrobiales bacterium]|nr:ATP-binding protein [Acidimicrobiales bacterium]HVB94090.1 ATP-binding protein [Acidimicrobiales bacterium]
MRRSLVGLITGIVTTIGLGAVMLAFRSHLSIASVALILVIPVVAGVATGGFRAGVASVLVGFLVYDFVFIPPYYRLTVGSGQNWVVLGVYVVVMLLVARVVASLDSARSDAQRRADETRRLFELSELLVEDRSVDELLETIVGAVATVFEVPGVALLVPEGDRLEIAAAAGEEMSRDQLKRLDPHSGVPVSLGTGPGAPHDLRTVALTAASRPVGILALRGTPASEADMGLLRTFANHAALALERARLREQALRSELLEEVDRLRHALMGAVSHDLRTPLATMKVASSTLLNSAAPLSDSDRRELYGLIDAETDRLTRLVTNLLDLTRFDAGVLEIRRGRRSVRTLVTDAVVALRSTLGERTVRMDLADGLPSVDVDELLIGQVLANLLDNADRHSPPDTQITVTGELRDDRIAISVADRGPGVPASERRAVFDRFVRFDTGGRSGLGLTIAKTFVEAHDEQIWVEDVAGGGARFVFTLPQAAGNGDGR